MAVARVELSDFEGDTVFVAMRIPYPDGSGSVAVLGVYSTEEGAQARCFIELEVSSITKECVAVVPRPLDYLNCDDYDSSDPTEVEDAFRRLEVEGL